MSAANAVMRVTNRMATWQAAAAAAVVRRPPPQLAGCVPRLQASQSSNPQPATGRRRRQQAQHRRKGSSHGCGRCGAPTQAAQSPRAGERHRAHIEERVSFPQGANLRNLAIALGLGAALRLGVPVPEGLDPDVSAPPSTCAAACAGAWAAAWAATWAAAWAAACAGACARKLWRACAFETRPHLCAYGCCRLPLCGGRPHERPAPHYGAPAPTTHRPADRPRRGRCLPSF